jgi:hypothetical protein
VTLQEIETYYSVDDLIDLHLALNMYDELARQAAIRARAKSQAQSPARPRF